MTLRNTAPLHYAALYAEPARQALLARAHEVAAAASKAPPSPCVSVCLMDPATGLCGGCLRSLPEIAAWSAWDDEARRALWAQLALRARALPLPPTGTQSGA